MKLGILGLGNMGLAIINGIVTSQILPNENIIGYDVITDKCDVAKTKFNVTCDTLDRVCEFSDILIIAVKPHDSGQLLHEVKDKIGTHKIILSICAGITISSIEDIIGTDKKVTRCMPNTPLLIGAGATGIAHNANVTADEVIFVQKIFQSVGIAFELDEKLLDAVTGLSGSGPAYVFMFIEALADGGVKAGLPRNIALQLAGQTVFGAAKLFLENDSHPGELKDRVTSPGGTTIEGISVLEDNAFRGTVIDTVYQAACKSRQLGCQS